MILLSQVLQPLQNLDKLLAHFFHSFYGIQILVVGCIVGPAKIEVQEVFPGLPFEPLAAVPADILFDSSHWFVEALNDFPAQFDHGGKVGALSASDDRSDEPSELTQPALPLSSHLEPMGPVAADESDGEADAEGYQNLRILLHPITLLLLFGGGFMGAQLGRVAAQFMWELKLRLEAVLAELCVNDEEDPRP